MNAAATQGVASLLGGASAMTEANSVKARKLYVGNLPLDMSVNEQSIKEFFDTAMLAAFPDIKVPPSPFPRFGKVTRVQA